MLFRSELAAMLIRGEVSDGQRVTIGCGGDKLTFRVSEPVQAMGI